MIPLARSVANARLDRKAEKVSAHGWGGSTDSSFTLNPHADITLDGGGTEGRWFNGGVIEDFEVAPGSSGKIVLYTDSWYFFHRKNDWMTKDDRGSGGPFQGAVAVSFSVDKDGVVKFGGGLPIGSGGIPGLLDHTFGIVGPVGGQDEGSVGISTTLKTAEGWSVATTQSKETSAGGSIGVAEAGGKGSVATTYGTSTSGSGTVTASYGIRLRVKKKKVTTIPNTGTVYFNAEGGWETGDAGIDGVRKWYLGLPKPIQDLVRKGQRGVSIRGYASETGSGKKNDDVVGLRLDEVQKHLKTLASNVKIESKENMGKAMAPPGSGPSQQQRRVEVAVEYTDEEAKAP